MSCDDCSTNNTCRGDTGSFDTNTLYRIVDGEADCEGSTDWQFRHSVNPLSGYGEAYDEVEGAFKAIYLNSYFDLRPDSLITDYCENQIGETDPDSPQSVEYYVRHPPSETDRNYRFENVKPDDSGDGQNYIVDTALDIVAGASSNPLVGAGTAVIDDFIGSWDQSSVDHSPYGPDTTRDKIWWDIDYDSNAGFPTGPCKNSGVSFELVPGVDSGDHTLNTWSRYTWGYKEYLDGMECVCNGRYITSIITTTDWVLKQVTFTFDG